MKIKSISQQVLANCRQKNGLVSSAIPISTMSAGSAGSSQGAPTLRTLARASSSDGEEDPFAALSPLAALTTAAAAAGTKAKRQAKAKAKVAGGPSRVAIAGQIAGMAAVAGGGGGGLGGLGGPAGGQPLPETKEGKKVQKQLEGVFQEATQAMNMADFTGSMQELSENNLVLCIRKLCGRDEKLCKLQLLALLATVNRYLESLRALQSLVKSAKAPPSYSINENRI